MGVDDDLGFVVSWNIRKCFISKKRLFIYQKLLEDNIVGENFPSVDLLASPSIAGILRPWA